jgi:hypothetical protein
VRVPHLSPTTLTTDEQRLILRATAGNVRDHVVVLNERHLHRLLSQVVAYYHDDRTHLGLSKGTPSMRLAISKPTGDAEIDGHPRIGGIHHRYEWRQAAYGNGVTDR